MSASSLPQRFSITEQARADGATLVAVSGELDLATASQLQGVLDRLADATTPTVVDLSELRFLDSTGLKVLLAAAGRSKQGDWSFALARGVSAPVARLFELVDADSLLPFESP